MQSNHLCSSECLQFIVLTAVRNSGYTGDAPKRNLSTLSLNDDTHLANILRLSVNAVVNNLRGRLGGRPLLFTVHGGRGSEVGRGRGRVGSGRDCAPPISVSRSSLNGYHIRQSILDIYLANSALCCFIKTCVDCSCCCWNQD